MIVVATGGRNRFHLVRQSLQDLPRLLYTQILWLPCIWPSDGTNQTAVFQRLSIRLPTGCLSRSLRLLCTVQTSFDHPATMPTIISPARIILPPPSIPDTQWHHGHPLRCPHPQSDVPDSHFSSHRHRTCNLPYYFVILLPLCLEATPIHP